MESFVLYTALNKYLAAFYLIYLDQQRFEWKTLIDVIQTPLFVSFSLEARDLWYTVCTMVFVRLSLSLLGSGCVDIDQKVMSNWYVVWTH